MTDFWVDKCKTGEKGRYVCVCVDCEPGKRKRSLRAWICSGTTRTVFLEHSKTVVPKILDRFFSSEKGFCYLMAVDAKSRYYFLNVENKNHLIFNTRRDGIELLLDLLEQV